MSSYRLPGTGVFGQTDGGASATTLRAGVQGIVDETVAGNPLSTGVLGESDNFTIGSSFRGLYASGAGGNAIAGVYGNFTSLRTNGNTNGYSFGVVGDVLALNSATYAVTDGSGAVLGAGHQGQFGMLGYKGLNGTNYSVYGGGANGDILAGNTGNRIVQPNNHIGLGISGGFLGGYVTGNQYGLLASGKEIGMYVQGATVATAPIVQLSDVAGENTRVASYVSTSTKVDVSSRGVGKLKEGTVFVAFEKGFGGLLSADEAITVTVTPTSETNGVFVSEVTKDGFYVRENQKGKSNASFNWIAIGTRAGFENGVKISETILEKDFDENMKSIMLDEGSKEKTEDKTKSLYYDGKKIVFERIPQHLEPKGQQKRQLTATKSEGK